MAKGSHYFLFCTNMLCETRIGNSNTFNNRINVLLILPAKQCDACSRCVLMTSEDTSCCTCKCTAGMVMFECHQKIHVIWIATISDVFALSQRYAWYLCVYLLNSSDSVLSLNILTQLLTYCRTVGKQRYLFRLMTKRN